MTEATYTFKQWEKMLKRIKCIDSGGHKFVTTSEMVLKVSPAWGSMEPLVVGTSYLQCAHCDATATVDYPELGTV